MIIHPLRTSFDANRKIDPLLENTKIHRVVDIVIPFLCLHAPTAKCVQIGVGGVEVYEISLRIMKKFNENDWKAGCKEVYQLAVVTTSIALSIVMPKVHTLFSQIHHLINLSCRLQCNIKESKLKEACKNCLKMIFTAIYLASTIYRKTELIALSMLIQILKELHETLYELREGWLPKGIASLAMASIRGYYARPYFKKIYREWFKDIQKPHILTRAPQFTETSSSTSSQSESTQTIAQKRLDGLLEHNKSNNIAIEAVPCNGIIIPSTSSKVKRLQTLTQKQLNTFIKSKTCSLKEFLNTKNLSNDIHGLKFNRLVQKQINHVNLSNCNFKDLSYLTLFDNVNFKSCSFKDYSFISSIFQSCNFEKSDFTNTTLFECIFNDVLFKDSNFTGACFNESTMKKVKYIVCKLLETNFCGVKVSDSEIINSDLTDCLLLGTKKQFTIQGGIPHKITRPVVGLEWYFLPNTLYEEYIFQTLKQENALVMKFCYEPNRVNMTQLYIEAHTEIAKINNEPSGNRLSLFDELLNRASPDSEIGRVLEYTQEIIDHVDAIVLTGGHNIEKIFIKKEVELTVDGDVKSESKFKYISPQKIAEIKKFKQQLKIETLNEINESDSDQSSDSDDESNDVNELNLRRSIIEGGLFKGAIEKKLPLLGICRGAQMGNIFRGGTLKNVEGHDETLHKLEIDSSLPEDAKNFVQNIVQDDHLVVFSNHAQACDKIGKGLQVVLEVDGVPKLLTNEDQTIVLTQFHPEFHAFCNHKSCNQVIKDAKERDVYFKKKEDAEKNRRFFVHLVEQARKRRPSLVH